MSGENSGQKTVQRIAIVVSGFWWTWKLTTLATCWWLGNFGLGMDAETEGLFWFFFIPVAGIVLILAALALYLLEAMGKSGAIVTIAVVLVTTGTLFSGGQSAALKEQPDTSDTAQDRRPVSTEGPVIIRKYGTIGLGDTEQVARSKLVQSGFSPSAIIASPDIPTMIIGQDHGGACREMSIRPSGTAGGKITTIKIGSGVLNLVFRDNKLFYIDSSFDDKEPTAGRMMEMSEEAYKSLLKNASDTGDTIGSVWRKGFVKYYSDRNTGLLLSVEIGAIGSSGAGSVPKRIQARLVLYDLSTAKSLE